MKANPWPRTFGAAALLAMAACTPRPVATSACPQAKASAHSEEELIALRLERFFDLTGAARQESLRVLVNTLGSSSVAPNDSAEVLLLAVELYTIRNLTNGPLAREFARLLTAGVAHPEWLEEPDWHRIPVVSRLWIVDALRFAESSTADSALVRIAMRELSDLESLFAPGTAQSDVNALSVSTAPFVGAMRGLVERRYADGLRAVRAVAERSGMSDFYARVITAACQSAATCTR